MMRDEFARWVPRVSPRTMRRSSCGCCAGTPPGHLRSCESQYSLPHTGKWNSCDRAVWVPYGITHTYFAVVSDGAVAI